MIARKNRFHGHGSLRFVYQNGRTVRGSVLSLKFVPNQKRGTYRLAVVVSKKVHKSAVVRNRIRRRLYEQVRLHQGDILKPHDMVLTVFSDIVATMPAAELEKAVQELLRSAKITTH